MRRILIGTLVLALFGGALAQQIRIMGYGGQDPAILVRLLDDVIGAELAAEGITLSYEPLEGDFNAALFNALSAGTAADIFYIPVETAPGIIATGKVLALDGLIDTDAFIDTLVEAYTVDGSVYGIAKDFNTLAIFYNLDLFEEAGVEVPNETDTWETFADKLRGVAALDDDVYGACFPAGFDRFGAFAFATGWQTFDDGGATNLLDPAFVEAVTWYTDLVREGVAIQPSDIGQGWTGGCFATDNVAVAIEGAWMLGFLRNEAPNLQYGSTFMPIGPSGERGNFLYTVAYGINTDSPNRDAAVRVLEALTSPAAQQWVLEEGLAIPSRTELADNPFFLEETAEAQANATVFRGAADGNVLGFQFGNIGTDWMTPVNDALVAIMTGQASVDDALTEAQRDLNALLDRAR
ncbi:MAG: extracellular solute-binding protein [Trueperaceae bacterium]|nr:MAG: extracellular solute-binding protein [Trueperaceae bacterium]